MSLASVLKPLIIENPRDLVLGPSNSVLTHVLVEYGTVVDEFKEIDNIIKTIKDGRMVFFVEKWVLGSPQLIHKVVIPIKNIKEICINGADFIVINPSKSKKRKCTPVKWITTIAYTQEEDEFGDYNINMYYFILAREKPDIEKGSASFDPELIYDDGEWKVYWTALGYKRASDGWTPSYEEPKPLIGIYEKPDLELVRTAKYGGLACEAENELKYDGNDIVEELKKAIFQEKKVILLVKDKESKRFARLALVPRKQVKVICDLFGKTVAFFKNPPAFCRQREVKLKLCIDQRTYDEGPGGVVAGYKHYFETMRKGWIYMTWYSKTKYEGFDVEVMGYDDLP